MPSSLARIACSAVVALALGSAPAADGVPQGGWRGARWGMSVEQVLRAFPGQAKRLDPEQRLADGNVVAAGIDRLDVAGQALRVRFVFGAGKLVLVSLRTPPDRYAGPAVFDEVVAAVRAELGPPAETSTDDAFVDLRQVRWRTGGNLVDVKYIPGVVAMVYAPLASDAAP